ncbi:MAG: D-sedoheptulose 7-phosphate isomerase [Candidatus Cloacimonadota bacterium]|nr:MAG: D-sedoheptulose 7-phosphate isomerase [Candidatus Cloacimonadota bacterium]
MRQIIQTRLNETIQVIDLLFPLSGQIEKVIDTIVNTLETGNKILLCGNGGSAADAQHIAAEFVVRFRSAHNRKSLPAIALTTDTSLLTACANDYGFEYIFSRQIESLGSPGDFLIGISTSGNSENVYQAIKKAKEKRIKTLLLSGRQGGRIKNIADFSLIVPTEKTAKIQEAHLVIEHIICEFVEDKFFNFKSEK